MTLPESLRQYRRPAPAADLEVRPGGYALPPAVRALYEETDCLEIRRRDCRAAKASLSRLNREYYQKRRP